MFRYFLVSFVVLFSFGFSHGGKGGALGYPNTEECLDENLTKRQMKSRKIVLTELLPKQNWFKECESNHIDIPKMTY